MCLSAAHWIPKTAVFFSSLMPWEAGLIQTLKKDLGMTGAEPSPAMPSCRTSPPASRLESTEIRAAAAG